MSNQHQVFLLRATERCKCKLPVTTQGHSDTLLNYATLFDNLQRGEEETAIKATKAAMTLLCFRILPPQNQ